MKTGVPAPSARESERALLFYNAAGNNFGDKLGVLLIQHLSGRGRFRIIDGAYHDVLQHCNASSGARAVHTAQWVPHHGIQFVRTATVLRTDVRFEPGTVRGSITQRPNESSVYCERANGSLRFFENATLFRDIPILLVALGSLAYRILPAAALAKQVVLWGVGSKTCLKNASRSVYVGTDWSAANLTADLANTSHWLEPDTAVQKRVLVSATRGPYSAACVAERVPDAVQLHPKPIYGDPGLLAPLLWPRCGRACAPSCDACLALHYLDQRAYPRLMHEAEKLAQHSRQRICLKRFGINLNQSVEEVVEFLLDCRLVISSALHGIIVAEAFGVPTRWAAFPPGKSWLIEKEYKYNDYYLGSGRNASAVRRAMGLHRALAMGAAPGLPPTYNATRFLEAFPFRLWRGREAQHIRTIQIGSVLSCVPDPDMCTAKIGEEFGTAIK